MNLHRLENESESRQLWRLGTAKENGVIDLDWDAITNILNEDWHQGDERTKKTYLNRFAQAKIFYADGMFAEISNDSDLLQDLVSQKQEIRKEKQKLFDERRDLNEKLRLTARREEDLDRIARIFQTIGKERYLIGERPLINNEYKSMIVCLSDLHIGSEWSNYTGNYSPAIAKKRLEKYLKHIIEIGRKEHVSKCFVTILGDCISGSIHKSISVTNKENVVEQVKLACEYLSDFVYELSKEFEHVEVYSVSGNHSRLDKKEDALTDERLDALIPWFMENMMMHLDNVKIVSQNIDSTFAAFSVGPSQYLAVHGDFDGINDAAVAKLCMWSGARPYCILTGHKHFPAMSEFSGVRVVQSGSLCGTGDNFTREKRLKGNPSQTVLICNEFGRMESMYPIDL